LKPLVLTPGQLSRRAEFYHQLGQLTGAGLGLIRSLEQLQRAPPSRSYREPLQRLLRELAAGSTLAESLVRVGDWLPDFDVALLHAGEQSGRLEQCFRLLMDYYQERARLARQLLSGLAYPVFLFHFAVFIFPFPEWFRTGDWIHYLGQVLSVLLPVYFALAAMVYAAQSSHGEIWRARLELMLRPVPVLGTARHDLALSRLAAALEALLNAGVTVVEAWELAARASGSHALHRTVTAWRPQLDAGRTPAEVVRASRQFPELFANQYATGELSGTLDDTLRRLQSYYQEEASRKLQAIARWVPQAVYLFVVLMIAYQILRFYLGYFGQLRDAGGF